MTIKPWWQPNQIKKHKPGWCPLQTNALWICILAFIGDKGGFFKGVDDTPQLQALNAISGQIWKPTKVWQNQNKIVNIFTLLITKHSSLITCKENISSEMHSHPFSETLPRHWNLPPSASFDNACFSNGGNVCTFYSIGNVGSIDMCWQCWQCMYIVGNAPICQNNG